MAITMLRQYSVFLPNTPGALCNFAKLFFDSGINIMGIASDIRDDSGVVRVAIEGDKRIGYILTQAGFTSIETPMISIEMPDEPGAVYRISEILGRAGININTFYGTGLNGQRSRILVSVDDPQRALEVLENAQELAG